MVPTLLQHKRYYFGCRLFGLCLNFCLFVSAISVISVLLILSSAAPVAAQSQCSDRGSIVSILGDRYAEKPVAEGMTQGGGVVEVFAANDGNWTMIITMPTGQACFMAAGKEWENIQQLVRGAKI